MKQIFSYTFILLLTLSSTHLCAKLKGQALVDSLLQELQRAGEDTNKANILNSLAWGFTSINPDEGIRYGQLDSILATKLNWKKGIAWADRSIGVNYVAKADYPHALDHYLKTYKIAEEIGNKHYMANVTENIGGLYLSQSDYPTALTYFLNALELYKGYGNKKGVANVTGIIGVVYYYQSNFPRALEYFLKALNMEETAGNKTGVAGVSCNVANVYNSQGDYTKALEYYFTALKANEALGNKQYIATVNGNIGSVYSRGLKDYPKALEYKSKELNIAGEIGNKELIATATGDMGDIYAHQKNYSQAIEFEQKALKIAVEISDKRTAAHQLENMGFAYLSLVTDTPAKLLPAVNNSESPGGAYRADAAIPAGKAARLHKAIDYLGQGLSLGREINIPDVMQDCYQYLATAYKLSGDYKKALEATDNFRAIKDSVFSKENAEKIVKMDMQNEYDRQHLADSLKTAGREKVAALQLQRQRSYTYMGVVGILLLAVFSFFIIKERGKSENERMKSDNLLLNILPAEVATELKVKGTTATRHFDNVSVLFTDFVNFTQAGERMKPQALIDELHNCFKKFDEITSKYNVEKIKTIGDAYLAVTGLPTADPAHAEKIVGAALEINSFMQDRLAKLGTNTFEIRIGIHSGSVVAGIVGVKKFAYDIWGDTVNTAARMEQNSAPGKINISQTTYELVKDKFACEYRGEIDAKGKGMLKMYYVS